MFIPTTHLMSRLPGTFVSSFGIVNTPSKFLSSLAGGCAAGPLETAFQSADNGDMLKRQCKVREDAQWLQMVTICQGGGRGIGHQRMESWDWMQIGFASHSCSTSVLSWMVTGKYEIKFRGGPRPLDATICTLLARAHWPMQQLVRNRRPH